MKILVTGGTGMVGSSLVRKLLALKNKHTVTIFARHAEPGMNATFVEGDITDAAQLEKAFPVDVVFHLAAAINDTNDAWKINVEGTRNVVDLCKKHGVKQLIHMSSCTVMGATTVASEDASYAPSNTLYSRSKVEAEKFVLDSGLRYTVIRAPVIIGPSRNILSIMKAAKSKYPIIGSGQNRFHTACVDDVTDLMLKTVGNEKAIGQVFNVAVTDVPTYLEFYKMLCEELGVEMTQKHLPLWLVKLVARVHTAVSKLKGKEPKVTMSPTAIDQLTRDRVIPIEKVQAVLGWKPKYTTRQALAETIKAFREQGNL